MNREILYVCVIVIVVVVLYVWMIWPKSDAELRDILTPEKTLRRADQIQQDTHLAEIVPGPPEVPDFTKT